MRRLFLTTTLALMGILTGAWAQGVKPLPSLHVEGRWLVDKHGNHVVLHGVMDTPNNYFNNHYWEGGYTDEGRQNCLDYFETLFTAMEKAKCTVFRLHLDPAWTNDPNVTGDPDVEGKAGEANISRFSLSRLRTYLNSLYVPLMQKAMDHGMYVVVRPPGVCPHNLQVGDYYQDYLKTVWRTVASRLDIKKWTGQVSLELANEPVVVKNAEGQDDPKALHDYFQPVVDIIREKGFTGILWIPGTGWQANYVSYATYPIQDNNFGYAVHDYTGWYGCSDESVDADGNIETSKQKVINQFHNQVPVVDTNPIIITEFDWSPKKPGTGHTNEHGQYVESNYGTWSTGSTSKWGVCYKAMVDHYQNISMTLSSTACLLDLDELVYNDNVTAAFGGLEEACGKTCMDWYAAYYNVDYPHADDEKQTPESQTAVSLSINDLSRELMIGSSGSVKVIATFQDGHERDVTNLVTLALEQTDAMTLEKGWLNALKEGSAQLTVTYTDPLGNELQQTCTVRSTYFPFAARYITTNFYGEGSYSEKNHRFYPSQWGQMGWQYSNGVDMSDYRYLVVKLKQIQNAAAHVNIFTSNSIWSDGFQSVDFGSNKQLVIDLQSAKTQKGAALDTKNIHIVSFWANGNGPLYVEDMYLTNNSDYSPMTAVRDPKVSVRSYRQGAVYDLQGRRVSRPHAKGLYIRNGKKLIIN